MALTVHPVPRSPCDAGQQRRRRRNSAVLRYKRKTVHTEPFQARKLDQREPARHRLAGIQRRREGRRGVALFRSFRRLGEHAAPDPVAGHDRVQEHA